MSFLEHLEELRWHLIRSVIAILIVMIVAFLNRSLIFDKLLFGPTDPDFPTYRFFCRLISKIGLESGICAGEFPFKIVNLELAGQFLVHLKSSLVLGFIVSFPYVFWEIWRFIRPALYEKEVTVSRRMVFFASLLFFIGVGFGYFLLMPFAVNFFGTYSVSSTVDNTFSLTNYIGFITMFVLAAGLLFELPLVVYFLAKLGLVGPDSMRTHRKHAFVVILFVAAVITPADVGTQLLVTVPVYLLYEFSIFIAARVERGKRAQMEAQSDE